MSPGRTRVKVCGLTRRRDALLAAELGADALGFVFAPRSRRRAQPDAVARIVEALPPFVSAVGVFQDQPLAEVRRVALECGLHLVQLHGSEDACYCAELGLPVLKGIGLAAESDLNALDDFPGAAAFLLDAAAGGQSGGTGQTFDWAWARGAAERVRVVLAGGLHAGNVAAAIRLVRPWAVDAASGTEAAPGVKDAGRLREFLAAVRAADRPE